MTEWTLSDVERLSALTDADRTFQMTEDAFRVFYELTARPVWLYLARMTGDRRLADDLLQDAYYRFLRTTTHFESDDHRRNYLFRIATNLVYDQRRKRSARVVTVDEAESVLEASGETADQVARRLDVTRAMARLKPRERSLLWLAYAQGASHEEIAEILGLKRASLKMMLFRARRRLMAALGTEPRGRQR
ncbi:MAG TPA: sigma-70 family RNA polymerase sigma factor [Vicinamibacterales bacterium]|jgi:RNA polymerase sigma-70 factor (ECF subfamily)|nr:sigma-70 family RNA polymerase sigma factor [Vicinamibacterales bacterium]